MGSRLRPARAASDSRGRLASAELNRSGAGSVQAIGEVPTLAGPTAYGQQPGTWLRRQYHRLHSGYRSGSADGNPAVAQSAGHGRSSGVRD